MRSSSQIIQVSSTDDVFATSATARNLLADASITNPFDTQSYCRLDIRPNLEYDVLATAQYKDLWKMRTSFRQGARGGCVFMPLKLSVLNIARFIT